MLTYPINIYGAILVNITRKKLATIEIILFCKTQNRTVNCTIILLYYILECQINYNKLQELLVKDYNSNKYEYSKPTHFQNSLTYIIFFLVLCSFCLEFSYMFISPCPLKNFLH